MCKWKIKMHEPEEWDGLKVQVSNFGYLPVLLPPDDAVKIWRFMDLAKFLGIIQSRTLYFARADQFEDPFEGARGNTGDEDLYVETLANTIREQIPDQQTLSDETLLENAKTVIRSWNTSGLGTRHMYQTFISCWHRNEVESDAMWRLYTKDLSQGVAIQSTCGRLRDAFLKEYMGGPITIAPVEYIDYNPPLGVSDNPCWFKKNAFRHENEVRAVILFDFKQEDAPIGLSQPINPAVLIENLYVSPTAAQWFVDLVKDLVGRYGYSFNVVQSKLLDKGFR